MVMLSRLEEGVLSPWYHLLFIIRDSSLSLDVAKMLWCGHFKWIRTKQLCLFTGTVYNAVQLPSLFMKS